MIQRRGVMLGLAAGLATASCVPPPPAPERPLYVTRTGEPPPTGSAPRAGVLLPLSGPQAETGRALLEAARQALGEAEPGPLVLVPQDTAVDPAVAARHAAEVGCGLLIGPIGSDDARAAVAVADRPTLALSNDATIGRQDLWPLGITPESQAERVVALAAASGLTRFGVLIPDDTYGFRLLRGVESGLGLHPGAARTVTITHPASGLPPDDLAQRMGEVEALLIGAGGAIPNVAARLLTGTQAASRLLGTLQWLREPDPNGAGPPPGGWIATPEPSAGGAFASRYRSLFGQTAGPLTFLIADAVGVAAAAARGGAFQLSILTRPQGFQGRLGAFRFTADGRVERLLAVVEIRGNAGLEVVDPAPQTFGGVPMEGRV
jgi:branched-chain amino acid transport system substrate-binding protein